MKYKYVVLSVFIIVFLSALIYVFVPPKIVVENTEAYIGTKYNANYDVTRFGLNYKNKTKTCAYADTEYYIHLSACLPLQTETRGQLYSSLYLL